MNGTEDTAGMQALAQRFDMSGGRPTGDAAVNARRVSRRSRALRAVTSIADPQGQR
jgi:hypothetical protein